MPLDDFSPKSFFLDTFVGNTLLLVVPASCHGQAEDLPAFGQVLDELKSAGVRGLLLFSAREHSLSFLPPVLEHHAIPWQIMAESVSARDLVLAQRKQASSWLAVALSCQDDSHFYQQVVEAGRSLLPRRVVFLDGHGGVRQREGGVISTVNPRRLAALLTEESLRRDLLTAILNLLQAGIDSISLCRMADLAGELFTYEGQGSYFSKHHYCQVRRLGIDDFPAMESLVKRGEQEGFLLPRKEEALLEMMLSGYGAFMAEDRMAGVCALLTRPYVSEKAGEVVGLYTLTRFQGEGVAGRLLHTLRREGRKKGLNYLFACTRTPGVVDFFRHHGFRLCEPGQLPASKWQGYDQERKKQLHCLRLDLEDGYGRDG
ncbi:MAG: GNAT family N-acetyltransferase [Magnetococcales bacterium]|nr:GNAT family N-acetyltransferase [Magnetococcales bacterium]